MEFSHVTWWCDLTMCSTGERGPKLLCKKISSCHLGVLYCWSDAPLCAHLFCYITVHISLIWSNNMRLPIKEKSIRVGFHFKHGVLEINLNCSFMICISENDAINHHFSCTYVLCNLYKIMVLKIIRTSLSSQGHVKKG